MKTHITNSARETYRLGQALAKKILKKGPGKGAAVLGLVGKLGSGKTTFVKGCGRGANIRQHITSPTYLIMRRFRIYDSRFTDFYHIDCYRIEKPEELLKLGFKKIIGRPRHIAVIEWADRVKKILPSSTRFIHFQTLGRNKRKVTIR